MATRKISEIIHNCIKYIETQNYMSYDPFDALTNPLIIFLTSPSDILRRIAIQINSRSPLDLHWLGSKKMIHTKTISDLLCYYSIRNRPDSTSNGAPDYDIGIINSLFYKLIDLKIPDAYAWGLNFPYTSRFINSDRNTPNLYNTVYAGISICYSLNKLDADVRSNAIVVLNGILEYIKSEMWIVDEKGQGWFQYYPGQKYPTYNVNALALYFLVLVHEKTDLTSNDIENKITKLINLLCKEQQSNGSWTYARSDLGKWIDGFHTGYILESIAFVQKAGMGSHELPDALSKGINYYIKYLFTEDHFVKYYSTSSKYPMDAQNYAQAIETLSLLGTWNILHEDALLADIISKSVQHLYNEKGYFNYKKSRYFTYRTPYFRWSVTPMILALEYAYQYLTTQIINIQNG